LHSLKKSVEMPFSKHKKSISTVLLKEGYIKWYDSCSEGNKSLRIGLKYSDNGSSVIETLKRISRPGLRIYKKSINLPKVDGGYGISIISTSQGLMSDREARKRSLGGEIICYVA
jgi:small subunit ribosomal protein S8